MKLNFIILSLVLLLFGNASLGNTSIMGDQPDSVYLFTYATQKNSNTNGLHFAWSTDQQHWKAIGPEHRFLFCDYGRWGVEKRMISPFLFQGPEGTWHCIWSLNEKDGAFAHAQSNDLIYWNPQTYPVVSENNNCLEPEISYSPSSGEYRISWLGTAGGKVQAFSATTRDFKSYSLTGDLPLNSRLNQRVKLIINGSQETGVVRKVNWELVDGLIKAQQLSAYKSQQWSENAKTDSIRFSTLKPLNATIVVDHSKSKKISDLLIGVFFEDINYAADGGLYAELIQNRDFEYDLSDREGKDQSWNSKKAWSIHGDRTTLTIDTVSPIHFNNPHYAILETSAVGAGLVNEGFDGIAVKVGEKYNFSAFVRNPDQSEKKLLVCLKGKKGEILGQSSILVSSAQWQKVETEIAVGQTAPDACMEITPQTIGRIELDMISLFPQTTFRNHPNGLRADLAKVIADIHPRFIRFPGGCVAHGDGLHNIYRWKNTIGPLESRKPQRNLWGYHQTAGLGYFEYFQFCADIGAEPLPVIAAGVPCQNSATGGAGQQGGIPMCEMDAYVQDVLDLIEWANGDVNTYWGKKRAEAGHPEPFNLKYIGIGNEDLINDIFEQRFTLIYEAVKAKHPEITVIGTVGPSFEGTDYVEGWKIASKLKVPMVDEHYYQSPGWFIHNQEFYDKYDRSKSKVYLGEYAAHLPGRPSNIETALAEALYLTALERNGDVVSMSSYAPLLAKTGNTQWNPNLIYFTNSEVRPTVNYFVQKLYGQNAGDQYIGSQVTLSNNQQGVRTRVGVSVVRDSRSNDLILKMVNMLPVAITAQVKLEGTDSMMPSAIRTLLTGKPGDNKATPEIDRMAVSSDFPYTMPAYSFTVIRFRSK